LSSVLQLVPLPAPAYRIPGDLDVTQAAELTSLPQWLAEYGPKVRAVVTHSYHGMPPELWGLLPALRLVANFGVGLDRIDTAEASRRSVSVTYTPDLLTNDVADLALGLLLMLLRRILPADTYVRGGAWGREPFAAGHSLAGRRLGILGMGRIGQAIARRAAAFDMKVAYFSRSAVEGPHERFDALEDLATWADVLVAALPGGDQTYHAINRQVLRALGPNGFFINVARGSVVAEDALLDALRTGAIAGAGLDVYDRQPHDGSQFRDLDNVVLTPHLGSLTLETRAAMAESVYANVRAALRGEALRNVASGSL
jgi:hydroxypyruvate reductase